MEAAAKALEGRPIDAVERLDAARFRVRAGPCRLEVRIFHHPRQNPGPQLFEAIPGEPDCSWGMPRHGTGAALAKWNGFNPKPSAVAPVTNMRWRSPSAVRTPARSSSKRSPASRIVREPRQAREQRHEGQYPSGVQALDRVDRATFQSLGGCFQNPLELTQALPGGGQHAPCGCGELEHRPESWSPAFEEDDAFGIITLPACRPTTFLNLDRAMASGKGRIGREVEAAFVGEAGVGHERHVGEAQGRADEEGPLRQGALHQRERSDSALIPADAFAQAKMRQWLFWEQYSHEPYIAVRRFQLLYLGRSEAELEPKLFERGSRPARPDRA
jgi:hypothetical protein